MSSVTGQGLPALHAFLNALPALLHTATPLMESSSVHAEHAMHAEHAVPAEHASLQSAACHGCAEALQHDGEARDLNMDHQKGSHVGNGMVQEGSQNLAEPQAAVTHFQVEHTFEVKGVGCVVSGTVVSGEVAVGQVLNLGPTGQGLFSEVQVTCIHRSQVHPSADSSQGNQLVCMVLCSVCVLEPVCNMQGRALG